jgi:ABC-2 type transport system permease protein
MFIINCTVALIYLPLFKSIYAYNNTQIIKGYTLEQIIWYFMTSTFVGSFVITFTEQRLSWKILSGGLSIDLLKPVSLYKNELAFSMSHKVLSILVQIMLPFFVCTAIIFPRFITFSSICRFLLLNIGGFSISFLINYLIGLLAFYIKDNNSIIRLKTFLISFTGGAYIPLEFFPDWSNRILNILPFKYIYYWPIQFFLNTQVAEERYIFVKVVLVQLTWIVVLLCTTQLFYRKVIKNYCAVGG